MRKTDSITKSLPRPYFTRIPNGLAKANPNNGKAIHDYIFAGLAELANKSGQPGISAIASALSVTVNKE